MVKIPYARTVSCLIYVMELIRPDISYVVSANFGIEHWKAVKWILRYLTGIYNHGLLYGGQRKNDNLIVGYVDSEYTRELNRRRSLTGYLFIYNNCTIK